MLGLKQAQNAGQRKCCSSTRNQGLHPEVYLRASPPPAWPRVCVSIASVLVAQYVGHGAEPALAKPPPRESAESKIKPLGIHASLCLMHPGISHYFHHVLFPSERCTMEALDKCVVCLSIIANHICSPISTSILPSSAFQLPAILHCHSPTVTLITAPQCLL
jgi:hypothetical protein